MAISYVSEVVKGNSFIQPFSLELMSKVNSYKQSTFYQNASKLENEISGLANADILNPLQKQRAQELTNNLTTQINNMSSLDYSDMNVSNTLEGMAGSVSQDDQVRRGVSSTKQVRELQSNIDKLKTDPKLNKFYSAANEEYALRPVQAYIKGGAMATFDGETAPTPYKGNPFNRLQDAVKKIMPDIEVGFSATNNPFFIEKGTRKSVDPDKVYAAISGSVDGDMLKQIQIDSWYNTKNFTPDQTLQAYNANYTNKLGSLTGLQDYYQKRVDAEVIPSVKAEYQRELDDVNNRSKQLTTAYRPKEIAKQLETSQGQEAVNYNIYSSRLFDDVVKAGSYKQMDKSLIQDPAEMWKAKTELAKYTASLKAQAASNKKKAADGTDIPIGNVGDLAYNTENAEQAASHKVTLGTYTERNNAYEQNINKDIYKFLDSEISLNPEYAAIFPETTIVSDNPSAGPTEKVRLVLDRLRKMDNNPNLSVQDIRLAIDKNNKMGLNTKQIDFFKNVVNVIDKAATGQINDIDFEAIKINKKAAVDVANSVNIKQQAIAANNNYIADVTKTVTQTVPQQYKKELLNYINNPNDPRYGDLVKTYNRMDKIEEYVYHSTPLGDQMKNVQEKYKVNKGSIEKLLNNDENRPNYFGMNFNQKGLEEAKIDIGTNIASSNNTKRPADLADPKDITPTDVRRDETTGKWVINYSYKDVKGKIKYSTPENAYQAPASLAAQIGLQDVPLPELESFMRYNKVSTPFYSYNGNLPGKSGVFKYDIGRVGNSRNPEGFVLRFYDDAGQVVQVKNGYGQQPFITANQAKTFADTITNQQTFADAFQNNRQNFFNTVNKIAYQ